MGLSSRCKICQAPQRAEIEALYGISSYLSICEQINAKNPELHLSPANISNHKGHREAPMAAPQITQSLAPVVESKPDFTEIDKLPPPDIVRVADFKINRLWQIQQRRDLSPGEEQLLKTWTEIKLRIVDQELHRQQNAEDEQKQAEARQRAEELIKELRKRANESDQGTDSGNIRPVS